MASFQIHTTEETKFETSVRDLNMGGTLSFTTKIGDDEIVIFFRDMYQMSKWYSTLKVALANE